MSTAGSKVGWRGQYKFEKETENLLPAGNAEYAFFDDFSTTPDTEYFDMSIDTDSTFALTRSNGILSLDVEKTNNFEMFEIPAAKVGAAQEKFKNYDKFVIEWGVDSISGANRDNSLYINRSKVQDAYADRNIYTSTEGTYYVVYDRKNNRASYRYPDGTIVSSTGIATDSEDGFSLLFKHCSYQSKTTYDYIAVYPLEETFKAEISEVTGKTAVLKTNMPIEPSDAALKVGDNEVNVEKIDNSYNIYKLTFTNALTDGNHILSGTANAIGYNTDINMSLDFSYEKVFEEAGKLFFDDFTVAPEEEYFGKATGVESNYPVLTRENGKLKAVKSGTANSNFAYFTIPASKMEWPENGASKFVFEWDIEILSSYPHNRIGVNDGKGYQLVGTEYVTGNIGANAIPSGKHYAIYDRDAKTLNFYYPDGTNPAKVTANLGNVTSNILANGFDIIFDVTSYNGTPTYMDYIAVYTYEDSFSGKLENVDSKSAILKTNMPLDLTKSAFTVGGKTVAVTKNDNTYNEYAVIFPEELAMGDYELEVNAVSVGASTTQNGIVKFTVDKEAKSYLFFDDFSVEPEEEYFGKATGVESNYPILTRENGKLKAVKSSTANTNFAYFTIPASKIDWSVSEATKFVIEWDIEIATPYPHNRVGVNDGKGYQLVGTEYVTGNIDGNAIPSGKHYVIYDRDAKTLNFYYPDGTNPAKLTATMGNVTSNPLTDGFEIIFDVTSYNGAPTYFDYIAVYPVEDDFTLSISDATEGAAVMKTNKPIDTTSAVISADGKAFSVEKLDNTYNKYIIRPESNLTVGSNYTLTVDTLKFIDKTDLTVSVAPTFSVKEGNTEITGIEIVTDANGNKVAKVTGTNNVVGFKPVVFLAKYTDNMLLGNSYRKVNIPYSGEFSEIAEGPSMTADNTASFKAFIWESMDTLKPVE